MSTTYETLIRDCAKALASGKWPIVSTTTSTCTNVTIKDSVLNDTRADTSLARFEDAWIRIFYEVTTANVVTSTEFTRKVMTFAANTNSEGHITFAPIITADNYNLGVEYEIHYFLHPSDLKDDINKTLRTMRYLCYYPLGLLNDADMEAIGTTDWTGSTGATVAKQPTVRWRGFQGLSVTDSNANHYVYQAFRPPEAGSDGCYAWVLGRVNVATSNCALVIYDLTGTVEVDRKTGDQKGWVRLGLDFDFPTDCEEIQVRLQTIDANTITYWDDACVYGKNQREFRLPTWVTNETQVGDVYYGPEGSAVGDGDGRVLRETALRRWATPSIEGTPGHFRVQIRGVPCEPMYIALSRPYEELTADTDTTMADKDAVVAGACYFASKRKGSDFKAQARDFLDDWGKHYSPPEPFGRFANAGK